MGRLLTLMGLMVLGALDVRTQQPSDAYFTNGSPNGLVWRAMPSDVKVGFALGVDTGSISTASELTTALYYEPVCQGMLATANKARVKPYSTYTNGDIIREMDAFYSVGANISLPTSTALRYVRMKLAGSTKAELDEYLKSVK